MPPYKRGGEFSDILPLICQNVFLNLSVSPLVKHCVTQIDFIWLHQNVTIVSI